VAQNIVKCQQCGTALDLSSFAVGQTVACPCGAHLTVPPPPATAPQPAQSLQQAPPSRQQASPPLKSILMAYLLFLVGGVLGFHKFYLGKNGTGVLYIFTLGLFGFGLLYDALTLPHQVAVYNDSYRRGYVDQGRPQRERPGKSVLTGGDWARIGCIYGLFSNKLNKLQDKLDKLGKR